MSPINVLVLPGWQNSGAGHWQSLWEARYGYQRVEQHDWMQPLRGDWIARLEELILDSSEPVVLVAHSLGCILTAAWAAHSRNTHRVKAALLVAPPDVDREEVRQLLTSWAPVPMQALPFPSLLVASSRDPYCRPDRAREFAAAWGSELMDAGPLGHLNADSGLGDWPEVHARLQDLMALPGKTA